MTVPAAFAWLNRSRWAHLVAAAVFAAVLVAQYPTVAIGHEVFTDTATQQGYVYPWAASGARYRFAVQSDQADLSLPAMAVQRRAYDAGELPHVDLYSYGGGYPLYADYSTAQAYPPRMVLVALFAPVDAHFLFTMLHLFGAGMFTYLLLRRHRCRWLPSVFGGAAWMLGGWTGAWMQLAPFIVLSALFPGALWAMHRLVARRTWEPLATSGVLLGALVVAGHVLFGVVAAAIVGIYGLALASRQPTDQPALDVRARWRRVAIVPGSAAVAVGVWAVALVPLAVASRDSARGALTYAELAASQLASWRDVGSVVWPYAAPVNVAQINALSFVGFATVAFAFVGLLCRRPGTGLGRALVVGAVVSMVGGPVPWLLFHAVPLMDIFRPYTRLAFFLGFGVVLLGAVGFDLVVERAGRRWPAGGAHDALRTVLALAAVAVMAANTVQLAHYANVNNPRLVPRSSASVWPDTGFNAALRAAAASTPDGWPGRAAVISPVAAPGAPFGAPILWAAEGAWVGVEVSSGYNSSMPTRSQRLLRVLAGEQIGDVLRRDTTGAFVPELWWTLTRSSLYARAGYDLVVTPPSLNASSPWGQAHVATGELEQVYAGADGNIFRIVGASPGAHGVSAVEIVGDDTAALRRFTDDTFDASHSVLLSAADAARATGGAATLAVATVSDATRGVNGYRFTVTAADRTVVVVPVNWGAGWTATANGHQLTLVRGNYNQIVVQVPAGTTHVSLQYRTPGFSSGAAITVVSLVLLLLVPVVRRRLGRDTIAGGDAT